jgi:hypothetical protein
VPIERSDPPMDADEKATLTSFLEYHRATLRIKLDGLTPEELVQRASPPSELSLLGLVRHLTEVESSWIREVFAGEKWFGPYWTEEDHDGDFHVYEADEASVQTAWQLYDDEVAVTRAIIAGAELDVMSAQANSRGEQPSLRWILVHLIEEYARHNGHADLLREAIDGATGE